jgi:hypothetical protein
VIEPTTILAQIQALLDREQSAPLDDLENTLTAGYAAALSLEAERWKLQQRMTEVTDALGGGASGREGEIAQLARRLTSADDEIAHLRGLLATLRAHTDAVRAA